MKQFYFAISFILVSLFASAQNAPFITTWFASNSTPITIPTHTGSTYNYTVDFGDGTILTNQTGDVSHLYNSAGTYTITISGNFPRIYFNNNYYGEILSVEQWGDIQWTSMESAFKGCNNLVINAIDAPELSQVTDMSFMFMNCSNLNQSIDHWDVSNITDMSNLFYNASSFNQPLNNWDVSSVKDMERVFGQAEVFNQPLNNWNVSSVLNMEAMFVLASSFNSNISSWNVSNVTNMYKMFIEASSFNQPLNNWNVSTENLSYFFDNCGMNTINYDNFLTHLTSLGLQQGTLGSNGLEYCNIAARGELVSNRGWNITGDLQSQNCNKIIGKLTFDENNNGCDPNDVGISNFMINATNGVNNIISYSNQGDYEIGVIGTNFSVSPLNYPSYYSSSPAAQTITFVTSNIQTADFCFTSSQTIDDLNITLLPTGGARPGFDADYQLVVQNIGTQTIANPSISLDFDNTMQTYVSASPNPSFTTANQLNLDFTSIEPFESKIVDVTMNTFQPPTVNGNDILSFTASVTPNTNDYTPADNTFVYDQTVVNSYDPNDKQVLQGEEIYEEQTDEYLDYLIRFQNTGTASAINVRILDTLHPNLDYNTLKPINASHDYHIKITDGNHVEFIFDDINLPDETSDEPGSHGFVAYKIKPKSNVGVGDFITGDAQIYFDFNAPIITNMVSTEVVDNLSTTNYDLSESLKVYPNPTREQVYLITTQNLEIEKVTVYNLQGKSLLSFDKDLETLNVEDLSTGIYLMKIETNRGLINKRLVKK